MIDREDPIRWTESGAPEGALALLAELDEPPPLPSAVRRRLRASVVAEVRPTAPIPWGSLLLAAAVGLLAFAAGWLWAGERPTPPEPTVAAPLAPERSEPASEEPERSEPAPEDPERTTAPTSEASEAPAASMETAPEPQQRPRRTRRRATMQPTRGLVDPFASSRSTMTSEEGAPALDPFAGEAAEPSPMNGRLLDPFRSAAETRGPSESVTGTLVINSVPWARVFVDGRDTGRNTPVTGLRVAAGRHRIGLRTPDGTMHQFTVTVRAGERVRVVRRL